MNIEPRKKNSLAGLLFAMALLVAGGFVVAYMFIEQREEKRLAEFIVSEIKKNDGEASIAGLNYNLLQNTLELTGVKVAFTTKDVTKDFELERILLRNPNRMLALDIMRGKTEGLAGVQPLADELLFEGGKSTGKASLASSESASMQMDMQGEAALISVTGIGVNLDVFLPALTQWQQGKRISEMERMVLLGRGVSYAQRSIPNGARMLVKMENSEALVTISSMTETNYADLSLERMEILGLNANFVNGQSERPVKLTQGAMIFERLALSPEAYEMSLDTVPLEEMGQDEALLKALFLGEKPIIGAITITDTQLTMLGLTFKWGKFKYENPVTRPFTASVSMDNLILPSRVVISNPLVRMFLNMDDLDISSKISVVVPVEEKTYTEATTFSSSVSVAELGSAALNTEGVLTQSKLSAMNDDFLTDAVSNFMASRLVMSYTDAGLVARGMGAARHTMGLDVAQLTNFLLATAGSDPAMNAQKEQFAEFLAAPGTISMSITPKNPMPLSQLLELKPGNEAVKLEVTKGSETLEEQLKKTNN